MLSFDSPVTLGQGTVALVLLNMTLRMDSEAVPVPSGSKVTTIE
jgi:hypothetical protein